MSLREDTQYFAELTRYTLAVGRLSASGLELSSECPLENKAAVEETLTALKESWKKDGIDATVLIDSPAPIWHLSSPEEALRQRSPDALRSIAAFLDGSEPSGVEVCGCDAADGGPIPPSGDQPWAMTAVSSTAIDHIATVLDGLAIRPNRYESAGMARAGAIAGSLRRGGDESVILWDLGAERSALVSITTSGIEAVAACSATFDHIFAATQKVLSLKFRGAASRLFFNDAYDFADISARIADSAVGALRESLSMLPAAKGPRFLACLGVTSKQAWFVREVAKALGLEAWEPDAAAVARAFPLKLAPSLAAGSLSGNQLGLLHSAATSALRSPPWHPEWKLSEPSGSKETTLGSPGPSLSEQPADLSEPPFGTRAKASLHSEPEKAAVTPVVKPVLKVVAPPVVAPAPSVPTPPPASHPPAPGTTTPPLPPGPKASAQPPAPKAPVPVPAPGAVPAARPAAAGQRARLVPASGAPTAAPFPVPAAPVEPPKKPAKSRTLVGITAAVALIALGALGYLYLQARQEKAALLEHQHQEEIARIEAERIARASEEKAKAEAEELALQAKKQASLAATPQSAVPVSSDTTEAERLSKQPGSLIVSTFPPSALVSIDGGPAMTAPAKFKGVTAGNHKIHFELANYEPTDVIAEIKGGKLTDLGTITLQTTVGVLMIKSEPSGMDFMAKTATEANGSKRWAGKTPQTLYDLPPGDYTVIFSAKGTGERRETIAVAKRSTIEVIGSLSKAGVLGITVNHQDPAPAATEAQP